MLRNRKIVAGIGVGVGCLAFAVMATLAGAEETPGAPSGVEVSDLPEQISGSSRAELNSVLQEARVVSNSENGELAPLSVGGDPVHAPTLELLSLQNGEAVTAPLLAEPIRDEEDQEDLGAEGH